MSSGHKVSVLILCLKVIILSATNVILIGKIVFIVKIVTFVELQLFIVNSNSNFDIKIQLPVVKNHKIL